MSYGWLGSTPARLTEMLFRVQQSIPRHRARITRDANEYTASYDAWRAVPMMTRSDLQSDAAGFSDTTEDHKWYCSSGSTGKPVAVAKSADDILVEARIIWGLRGRHLPRRHRSRTVNLFRNPDGAESTIGAVGNSILVDVSFNGMKSAIEDIRALEPEFIFGPPTAIARFIRLLSTGSCLPSVRLVESRGEYLSPRIADEIRGQLAAPLRDMYGTTESGVLSYTCAVGRAHALSNAFLFEVLTDDGPALSGSGQLIVTSTFHRATPLVRYVTDDVVVLDPGGCLCGEYPTPQTITFERSTRDSQLIQFRGGEYDASSIEHGLASLLCHDGGPGEPRVSEFQLEQVGDALRVRLVGAPTPSPYRSASIRAAVAARIPAMPVEIVCVPEAVVGLTGKTPLVLHPR